VRVAFAAAALARRVRGLATADGVAWRVQRVSSLVHGYARRPDMVDMSEIFQCAVAGLGIDAWLEWVPSAANVADVPSRLDKDQGVLERVGARRVPLIFPTAEQWDSPASLLGGAAADRAAHAPAR
jgi:hypothetical protein